MGTDGGPGGQIPGVHIVTLRRCLAIVRGRLRRRQAERELDEEMRTHLDMAVDENIERGMNPREARVAARRRFGVDASVKEGWRQADGLYWLDTIGQDVRYAIRTMRRSAGFTAAAVVTLALCIGANTAVFSVVNAVLVKPLPYPEADALVSIWHDAPGLPQSGGGTLNCSPSMFFSYAEANTAFEWFGLWSSRTAIVAEDRPQRVAAVLVTHGVLDAFGVPPELGRVFSRADDAPGSPETALLAHGYWQRQHGGDPAVVGRTVNVNGRPREIVGVMPRDFRFLTTDADLFLPYQFDRAAAHLGDYSHMGLARLRPGVTLAQADSDIDRMLPSWLTAWPVPSGFDAAVFENLRLAAAVQPLKRDVIGDLAGVLWVVMGTVGVVLLIGCANVANLMLVRTEGRHRELAVRAALGAGWERVARTLLCESVVWALVGGLMGLVMAYVALRVLVVLGPDSLPRLDEIAIDRRVLAFTAAMSVLSGLLCGLASVFKHAPANIVASLGGTGGASDAGAGAPRGIRPHDAHRPGPWEPPPRLCATGGGADRPHVSGGG